MNKYELTTKLVDRLIDPYTDCPEDYEHADPLTLSEANGMLKVMLQDDKEIDDPDYCVPAGTTPELLMEVFNCLIRKNKHQLHVERLAEYITDNEMVCEYDNYYKEFSEKKLDVYPSDFIWDSFPFKPIGDMSPDNPLFLIQLGQRSKDFDANKEFSWYDRDNSLLHSTNTPFADGILDAEAFAEFILGPDGSQALDYFLGAILDENEIRTIFGCDEQEVRKLYNI